MSSGIEGDNDIVMEGCPKAHKILTLQEELQEALRQEVLSFTGNHYHAQLQWSAPNPCLSISGLGPIGLPLAEDHAKRIISVAYLAHGECGALNVPVRGIWEIKPAQISFLNPTWDSYISTTLCQEICTALGALTSAPKMVLRRLLLYQEGANCPLTAHHDPQGADGIFATVTLFLPSAYDGGEVVLSHASTNTTINFAAESAYASAALAWYTDIPHEVRPVSSGYRLALSYDVIHTTASTEPCPSPPKTLEAAMLLRTILCRWRDTLDSYETEQYRMAYLLDHTYDLKDVKDVVACLKGVDAHRARILRNIGSELGFTLGVASLEYNLGKISDVIKDATSLKQLTGLDGEPLFGLTKPLKLPKKSIFMVSDTASNSSLPGKRQSNYRSDNGGKRSVLLLVDGKRHDDLRFEVEGLSVAAEVLRETSQIPPSRENILWANRILQKSDKGYSREYTHEILTEMLNYSLDWENIKLWKRSSDTYLWDFNHVHSDILFKAYRTFPFDEIRESFSRIMRRSSSWHDNPSERPGEIITFLHTLSAEAAKEGKSTVQSWCQSSVNQVLSGCWPKGPHHAESVLQVMRLVGTRSCRQYLFPYLFKHDDMRYFGFWMALHKVLRDQRQSLLEDLSKLHPDPHVPTTANSLDKNDEEKTIWSTPDVVDALIEMSLHVPSFAWFEEQRPFSDDFGDFLYSRPHARFNPIPGRIDRLLLVLGACVRSSNTKLCDSILEQALEMTGNPMWYFAEFYIPVISNLRNLLAPLNQDIMQPPFANFIRTLISRYLSQVLGKRGPVVDIGLRKLSCEKLDCATCKKVNAFILSTQPEIQLRVDPEACYHAEGRLETAIDLCTYGRLEKASSGRRFRSCFGDQTLEIKKHESVVQCSSWDYRLSATKAFLESIGSDSDIEDIMGDRYADVQSALDGRRKFVWDEKRDSQAQVAAATETSKTADAGDSSILQERTVTAGEASRVLRRSKRKRA